MTKNKFLDIFETAMDIEDITHISVKVVQPTGGYEVITFGRELFKSKHEYYKNAYDDDMKLKTFNKIAIAEINFSNNVMWLASEMFR
ncbi:hypothetical protein [uncultured Clostridium sp.]|uniref:hypothetical protein n=1 Tax=uncultured Clostridium sp. TaxID=59620 RepID=UPI00261560EA|nr:hypothetical protein [uncultured Clostridium sp.]